LQQQVPIDVLGRDHADQPPLVDDHHGVRVRAVDEFFTRIHQFVPRRCQRYIRFHNRHHRRVGSLRIHGLDEVRPCHNTDEHFVFEHGKIVLSRLIDQFDTARHRVRGRKKCDPLAHHIVHRQFAQHAPHPHDAFLAFGAEEDKRPDQDEPERELQSRDHEQDGQSLSHHGGNRRGLSVREHECQHRAQQPPAIHRKRGDKVENEEREIGLGESQQQSVQILGHVHDQPM